MDLFELYRQLERRVCWWIPTCTLVIIAGVWAVFSAVRSYTRLRHIPGPRLAALTNLVRRSWVITGNAHEIHTDLHRKYGKVVRFGPNAVMVSQPGVIEKIYGFKNRFQKASHPPNLLYTAGSLADGFKSEFYDSIMPRVKGGKIPDVFATRDEDIHRRMRRPVANLYSVTSLTNFEPLITSTMQYFFIRVDEIFSDKNVEFDLYRWIQFFMFDVLGEVTFSQRLGVLEKAADVEDVIENLWLYFEKVAPNTQMQWLDYLWRDNPLVPVSSKRNALAEFGAARIMERMSQAEGSENDKNDFLSYFIKEKAKDNTLPDMFVPTWVNSNIVAGADTTSIVASALMYHLLKNPSSLSKLKREIDDAVAMGRISKYVTWRESQNLPYLEACVNEATRMHPPFALPFERIVPDSGLEVDGYFVPPGTRVGMSPWVVHRDESIFGGDPEAWRPERWLCSEKKKTTMYNTLLTFGAGHRTCLGKHLAYYEIYKLIPSILQRYDIQLVNPAEDWSINNRWLAKPSGFRVKLSTRG
ncbi:putative Cytochrome P450 [Seiridium unicorne]|uniref:Cytochrome P450 n=1 Tax=Seiridium unicorne TaxID=138068 RepID=A0ABR2UIP6_9PEZI